MRIHECHESPAPQAGSYTLPTRAGARHQRMESTSTSCNQWFSLAKIALKVPLVGRNRSLVAITNMCGEGIRALLRGLGKSTRWEANKQIMTVSR
jgi:hypothetical protein